MGAPAMAPWKALINSPPPVQNPAMQMKAARRFYEGEGACQSGLAVP